MRKLWGGAFGETSHERAERFGGSLETDLRFWREDVEGSIAHARMLGATGILAPAEAEALVAGLTRILEEGPEALPRDAEDVHTAVEARLAELAGEVAGRLHTARSRNDQVATDARLFVRRRTAAVLEEALALQDVLYRLARQERATLMPGYTHQQPAQPVTLGFHLLAHFWALQRCRRRFAALLEAVAECPLGSAALAGTGFPIDRHMTARELGFARPSPNALDATSDRSWVLDGLHACAALMLDLSRLSQELVLWSGAEFGFVRLGDAVTTGSSIMPQKRNPDVAELIRGRAGRAIGLWTAFAATMKGLPLGYNRDMQDDKPGLFEAMDLCEDALALTRLMLEGARWDRRRLAQAAGAGMSYATDLADVLVARGLPFRQAHEIVGAMARSRSRDPRRAMDAVLSERVLARLSEEEARAFDPCVCVLRRESFGGPGPGAMREQLRLAGRALRATRP
jgi:argininosuccinate lyase